MPQHAAAPRDADMPRTAARRRHGDAHAARRRRRRHGDARAARRRRRRHGDAHAARRRRRRHCDARAARRRQPTSPVSSRRSSR
jgi:hypothetical protein